jgi:type IV pilus biogenesis protein CpaD/CtpE
MAVLTLALVAALITGCGSSDSSAASSKPEYLEQANEICKKGLKEKDEAVRLQLSEAPRHELKNPSDQWKEEFGEHLLPPVEGIIEELSGLTPPANDQAAMRKIVAELKRAVAKAAADPILLTRTDPFAEAGKAAQRYGLKECLL